MIASLATRCTEAQAVEMIASSDFFCQEKMDGKRIMVWTSSAGVLQLLNRNGLSTTVPQGSRRPILPHDSCLDCEFMHGTHAWIGLDLLRWAGEDLTRVPAAERYRLMTRLPGNLGFTPVETAFSLEDKAALLLRLRLQKAEGLIFRRSTAPYSPGLITAGGPIFKLPWRKRMDVVIRHRPDSKRAFTMSAFGMPPPGCSVGAEIEIGHVAARHFYNALPQGSVSVAECEYLYASKHGRLVQPQLIRLRSDKQPEQCHIAQMQLGGRHA